MNMRDTLALAVVASMMLTGTAHASSGYQFVKRLAVPDDLFTDEAAPPTAECSGLPMRSIRT